jgi:Rrf2 family iron-sulfur cluster assembly transcriptional regulator
MITRKSDLALRALRTLAAGEGVVRGEELAGAIGTTRAFLSQVMTPLVRARWVDSSPGPLGGYRLRSSAGPSVLDVIEAMEGPADMSVCVLDPESACASVRSGSAPTCALHDAWIPAQQAMREELSRRPAISATGRIDQHPEETQPREAPHVP